VNLRSLDLNLLVALSALLEERHVTRAARALGMSQSAMSHALGRLRAALSDELLVRGPSGLVPTARAEALREPLREALSTLSDALDTPRPFEAATARRAFTVAASDYVQLVVLPRLVARLQAEAPGVDLWIVSPSPEEIATRLADGTLDLDIGVPRAEAAPGLHARRLFDERFVCVVREGHPRVRDTLTLEDYVDLPHAFVAPRGRKGGAVDSALAKRGLERRVAVAVPHFLVMPTVIASSDLIVTLASRVARSFAEHLPLRLFEPPIPLPSFSMQMTWHERAKSDPGHQWLRALLVDVTRELDSSRA
jgi:DNA-binding transcriptional LysR family regulator